MEHTQINTIEYTTALRGIAILIIMLAHCFGGFTRALTPLGGIGVSIFLILSGYGLTKSAQLKESGGGGILWWKKRIVKVWVPWFILISSVTIIERKDIGNYLLEVSIIHPSYWYLQYIFYCYFVFFAISQLYKSIQLPILLMLSISTLFFLNGTMGEQAFSFVTGCFIGYKNDIMKGNKYVWRGSLLLMAIGLLFLLFKQTIWYRIIESHGDQLQNMIIINVTNALIKWPIALSVIFGGSVVVKKMINPFLLFIGGISYELYLVHFQFLPFVNDFAMAFAVIMASIPMSWLFCKINKYIQQYLML